MFRECSNLTSLTFGANFSTESATSSNSLGYTFIDCPKLRYIDMYASDDTDAVTSVNRSNYNYNFFSGTPRTAIIFLPHGSNYVTTSENVVYSYGGNSNDLRCPTYYSEDKVDIEFPRSFKANEVKYTRTMNAATKYGTVVLPYAFTTNNSVQAYTLNDENTETMYFVEAETIPAHTSFFYKKKTPTATTVNFNNTGSNYNITVNATRDTSKDGGPYTGASGMTSWGTRGYYVTEEITADDGTFYISGDKFMMATGTLKMNPHRVTFHGAWNYDPFANSGSRSFNIMTLENTGETPTGIDDELPGEIVKALDAADIRSIMGEAVAVYDAQGRLQGELQKGLNMIRMKDGRVIKLFKK